jgi:U4/U6 small nuclear ribonucleoprotein PRP4
MRAHDLQKRARNLPVPTNDKEVKLRLRELGHPICLFGEDPGDRRERLRAMITEYYVEKGEAPAFCQRIIQSSSSASAADKDSNEVFYTEGSEQLKQARLLIAKYSLPRGQQRVDLAKMKRNEVDRVREERDIEEYLNKIGPYEVKESQYADDRCVSRGCLSPNEELFATSGWSGICKVWGIPDCEIRTELRGHNDRVNCIRFHPYST